MNDGLVCAALMSIRLVDTCVQNNFGYGTILVEVAEIERYNALKEWPHEDGRNNNSDWNQFRVSGK